ncbi:MAG: hypothetical protein R3F59_27950 [Myxococcota bacterium]
MSPAMPEAPSVWPRLDFTEPMRRARCAVRPVPRTLPMERHSVPSPTGVPVPWASTKVTSAGSTPALVSAACSTDSCASWLGTEMPPSLWPSEFTAVPRITA